MTTPPLAVLPLSITVTVIVAVPEANGEQGIGERAGGVGAGVVDRQRPVLPGGAIETVGAEV